MKENRIHAEVVEKPEAHKMPVEEVYTCEEVAKMYRVKVITVWDWVRKGKIKAVRLGKRYRIKKSALAEFEKGGA